MKLEGWIGKLKPVYVTDKYEYFWVVTGGTIEQFIEILQSLCGENLLHERLISIEPITIPEAKDGKE